MLETESLIKTKRGIERFDMNRNGLGTRRAALEDVVQQPRADPCSARFRGERDVHDTNLVAPFVDPETADGTAV